MTKDDTILRLGRRDLRFVHQAGVYVLATRRLGGRARLWAVGQSDHIARDARQGGGDFARADQEGVEDAIVVLERDPAARRRLAAAVAATLATAPTVERLSASGCRDCRISKDPR